MFSVITGSPEETRRVGRLLAGLLRPGDVVCLYGDLGAGKTNFAFGIATGLDVGDPYVTSPTFTFVNEYQGRVPFYHIDLYRLKEPSELEGIGFDEYVDSAGVTVIEWPERAGDALPRERLSVYLSHLSANSREIGFLAEGERYAPLVGDLKSILGETQQPALGNAGT